MHLMRRVVLMIFYYGAGHLFMSFATTFPHLTIPKLASVGEQLLYSSVCLYHETTAGYTGTHSPSHQAGHKTRRAGRA